MDINLKKKPCKCYTWNLHLCGAENFILRKGDQKFLERFGMWFWKRLDKIIWIEPVRNDTKRERNIIHEIKWKKDNRIGHILGRYYLIK